jgi:hypothetical protein
VLPTSTSRAEAPTTAVKGERFIAETGSGVSGFTFAGFALLLLGATAHGIVARSARRES